jgi:CheY-like chemotaxis protein
VRSPVGSPPDRDGERFVAHILIVDDDPSVCDVVDKLLGSLGFEVTTATTGRAALEAAARHSFAAAIVDLCMPTMHGLEIIRNLKAMTPQTRLIVMSGLMSDCGASPTPDFLGMMADFKGAARLSKPFGRRELMDLLGDCRAEAGGGERIAATG